MKVKSKVAKGSKQGKSSNPPRVFEARCKIDSLRMLFEYIKTHTYHAEDHQHNLETYTTAIEAIAEMGIRKCEAAIAEARHG